MMILILVICIITVFFFIRQYRKEMRDRKTRSENSKQAVTADPAEKGDISQ